MTIGEKIRELRLNKNISIEDICRTSEIPVKKLKRIENDLIHTNARRSAKTL